MPARRHVLGLYAAAVLLAAITTWYFVEFTADDAYIVARYAVNARDAGDWAFNTGEHVTALTSPLHGLLLRVLSFVAADPLPLYKAIALMALVISWATLLMAYGMDQREAPLVAAIIVGPSVILWTFAGLETPLLAAIVSTITAAHLRLRDGAHRWIWAMAALSGLAVVARYDAVLFAGPVLLAALLQRDSSWAQRASVAAVASVLPTLWFLYSSIHFGAILPTSFYIKTPTAALEAVAFNLRYMVEHLVITGCGVLALYAGAFLVSSGAAAAALRDEVRTSWGLHVGLLAVLAYGATMATVHMMFAFRHFVPYLGALAAVMACVARRADDRRLSPARRPFAYTAAAALAILTVHAFHAEALYARSLQGLGSLGEYAEQGAAAYARDYIPAMERNAADVKTHWKALNMGRPPRIWTFAAGALPYAYRDAYIFEALVSYRHQCPRGDGGERADGRIWRAHADYIHAFTRHGSRPRLLAPMRTRQVQLISTQEIHFNGRDEQLLVYYNPTPRENVLPPGIDDPCREAGAARR